MHFLHPVCSNLALLAHRTIVSDLPSSSSSFSAAARALDLRDDPQTPVHDVECERKKSVSDLTTICLTVRAIFSDDLLLARRHDDDRDYSTLVHDL